MRFCKLYKHNLLEKYEDIRVLYTIAMVAIKIHVCNTYDYYLTQFILHIIKHISIYTPEYACTLFFLLRTRIVIIFCINELVNYISLVAPLRATVKSLLESLIPFNAGRSRSTGFQTMIYSLHISNFTLPKRFFSRYTMI